MIAENLTSYQEKMLDEAARRYQAAYILMTLAIGYMDDGDIFLKKAEFRCREIKRQANLVSKHYDIFCRVFQKYLEKDVGGTILEISEQCKKKMDEVMEFNNE